jgi:precorrin-2 dehydrogenase/sirohydrochlorin ferrochelatase
MPFAYPVSLELRGRRAIVIGDDAVRHGKVEPLLLAGASVTVVAHAPPRELARLGADPRVEVRRRGWRPDDLDGAFVCVATDPIPKVRAAIRRAARERRVLVNMVDDIPNCDFAIPAIVRRGDLLLTVSTGGRSPALARRLREDLEDRFGPEWAEALRLLAEAREATLPSLPDVRERSDRWREALHPEDLEELVELVRDDRSGEARAALVRRLLAEPDSTGAAVG